MFISLHYYGKHLVYLTTFVLNGETADGKDEDFRSSGRQEGFLIGQGQALEGWHITCPLVDYLQLRGELELIRPSSLGSGARGGQIGIVTSTCARPPVRTELKNIYRTLVRKAERGEKTGEKRGRERKREGKRKKEGGGEEERGRWRGRERKREEGRERGEGEE